MRADCPADRPGRRELRARVRGSKLAVRQALVLLAMVASLSGCMARSHRPRRDDEAPPGFLKGQLHIHSAESGDADTPADDVVDWYAGRGYDFILLSDHNGITQPPTVGDMLVLPGTEVTSSTTDCDPPPQPGLLCMVHVNSLFVETPKRGSYEWSSGDDLRRLSKYERAVDHAMLLGGLPMLNHPGFHYTADEKIAARLGAEGVTLIEVFNQRTGHANRGDALHLSSEQMWDYVLDTGVDAWAVASDDAHHVGDDAEGAGDRGWVYVRAERNGVAIRDAVERGDFYSSTGPTLTRLEVVDGWLELEVPPEAERSHFSFIGSGGQLLYEVLGTRARFPLADALDYVRAVVTDESGGKAWTQPIR